MSDVLNKYGAFVNPLVSEILYSLGAETLFERAENHIMTGFNSIVEEKKVIDLTCGYGSLMFGHNNPEIIEEACRFFQDRKPIHVQFSAKKYTAELAETMATICKDITGIDVIVRFANSGTEAVDLAIKHCEFKRVLKIQDMQKSLEQRLLQLTKRDDQPEIKIPGSIFSDTELREQIFDENLTIEQFHGYLTRLNAKALQARPIIFALKQGFHGKSIGACQLTHNGLYRKAFMYLGINAIFIDPENLFEIETIISNLSETLYDFRINNGVISLERKQFPLYTAVIAEPIQGEGGIREIDPLALKELKSICEKNEIPLIFDEIQSGLGRSGKFFASQDSGVNAEIYLLGKSLGGGLTKISAVLIKKDIYEKSFGLIHTSTFAEDEFSSAIGLKVLDMLKRDNWAALDEISRKGEKLKRGLLEISQEYPGVIKEVRGKGLLIGVEFESFEKADSAVLRNIQYWKNVGYLLFSYMQESEGIRALPTASAPSTLRLEPGVTISDVEINDTISAFRRLCKILYNQDGYLLIRHMCNTNRKCVSENEIENFKTGEYTEKYNNANTNSPIRKIGFVAHAIGVDELERVAPELQRLSSEERWEMYNRRSVYSVNAPGIPLKIKSKQGVEVEVRFYIINRTAKQLIDDINGSRLHELQSFLSDNVRIAKKDGCSVIGFGGFSSIAANNCRALEIVDGIAVTSGNALTTGLGFGAMLLGAQKCGLDIENADAAVIGGAGNIGQVYGALLAEKVKKVYLIGSKKSGSLKRLIRARQKIYDEIAKSIINIESDNQISGIVSEIAQISGVRKLIENTSVISMRGTVLGNIILEKYNEDPFIFISDNLEDIKKTKLIACCANAAIPFIGNEFVEAGSVVCDIGVPPNCKAELYKRSDIEVMCGGLAKLPNNQILNAGFMNVEDGFAYGCLTETIVMGILGIKENYSFGDISASQVKEITAVAHALGFKLADKYRYSAQF